jgi:hypothetical protein
MKTYAKYPQCWPKVSRIIRRLANGHCEWCHKRCYMWELSVHHIGAPLATGRGWKRGNPSDKHDIRRENLVALCKDCHASADAPIYKQWQRRKAKREAQRQAHAALQIGTGLVAYGGTSQLLPTPVVSRGWRKKATPHPV